MSRASTLAKAVGSNGDIAVSGSTTLGDAAGDNITINASTASIPNGLNFDSNTLVIDSTNNRIGIGTASPNGILNLKGSNGQLVLTNGNTAGGVKLTATDTNYTANGYLAFEGYANEYSRFDSVGNFMVGYTATSAIANKNIDVNGTGDASFNVRVGGQTCAYLYSTAGQTILGTNISIPLTFYPNNVKRMSINTDGTVIIGNAVADTNVGLYLNGVINRAQRIIFQESGVEKWLIGQGAASETSAFEIYNSNGTMAMSINKSTSVITTGAGLVVTGSVGVNGVASPASPLHVKTGGTVFTPPTMNAIGGGTGSRVHFTGTEPGLMLSSDLNVANAASTGTGTISLGLQIGYYAANDVRSQVYWAGTPLTFTYGSNPTASPEERIRIATNGNVGIGTTNPQWKLEVASAAGIDTPLTIRRNDWQAGEVRLNLALQYAVTGYISSGITEYVTDTGYIALNYKSGSSTYAEGLRVSNTGRVGIGTTEPGSPLTVNKVGVTGQGAADTYTQIYAATTLGSGAGLWFGGMGTQNTGVIGSTTATGNIAFQTYNSGWGERMRITNTGKVAVGQPTVPTDELMRVAGNFGFGLNSGLYGAQFGWVSSAQQICPITSAAGGTGILVLIHGHGDVSASHHGLYWVSVHYNGNLNSATAIVGSGTTFDTSGGYLRITGGLNVNWTYGITCLRQGR